MAVPLVLTIARITWSSLARGLKKAPAGALRVARSSATATASRILIGVAAVKGMIGEELKMAKSFMTDQVRVYMVKTSAKKAFGDLTQDELIELEAEVRESKLGFTSAVNFALKKFALDGFHAAMVKAESVVDETDLQGLQTLSSTYGITPPAELSQDARDSIKAAIRTSFQKTRDEGNRAIRAHALECKQKMAAHEIAMKERIKKAAEKLKAEAAKLKDEAAEAAKLLAAGMSPEKAKLLRARSTTQIQKLLENVKQGDGRSDQWTKAELEAVLRIRLANQKRKDDNAKQ